MHAKAEIAETLDGGRGGELAHESRPASSGGEGTPDLLSLADAGSHLRLLQPASGYTATVTELPLRFTGR